MNIRWLFGNFTDPRFDLSRAEQKAITKLAHEKYCSPRALAVSTFLFVAGGILLVMGISTPLSIYISGWFGVSRNVAFSIAAGVLCLFVIVASAWGYKRWVYDPPVRRAMRQMGYDICVDCSYDLRGQDDESKRCPECGCENPEMGDC